MRCPCVWCVLFVTSRSGIVFNPGASVIADHSQSAKNIDPYFNSQLYVEDPPAEKTVRSLPNGKPGERMHDRNYISARGKNSNPQPLDRQSSVLPLSYHN